MYQHEYWVNSGDFSLAISTAKTALEVITGTSRVAWWKRIKVSGASVTATDPPFKIEVRERSTSGTSTSFTPIGNALLPGVIFTARNTFTVEGTDVGPVFDAPIRLSPIGGALVYDFDFMVQPISKHYAVVLTPGASALSSLSVSVLVAE